MKFVAALGLVLSLVLSVALAFVDATDQALINVDADAGANVTTMIQRRGYAVEVHRVVTADRYVLTMYRLPKSFDETQRNAPAAPNKPAVYLIHGLLDSSFTWVNNYRNQSLAYILADAGYDVWLGNNRGSTWSRDHLDLSPKDDKFWDFTWHEMGKYDLPAMLHYVLNATGRETLSYIGHSEGTTQAFVGFSLDQELAKKVSYFGALGPVAWVADSTSVPFQLLARANIDTLFRAFGVGEFGARSFVVHDVVNTYGCALPQAPCDSIIQWVVGSSQNLNTSRIHVYISQTPAGTSVKTMAHYAQSIRDDTFRRFDYGCGCVRQWPLALCSPLICKNKEVYGSFDPPAYDLGSVQYPRMSFFTGAQDALAVPADVAKLRAHLPAGTIVADHVVPDFNHLDYSWAINAKTKVYDTLLAEMKLFDGQGYH